MNLDPTSLDRLHDIVVPPPVPWWPPAAGWRYLLALLAVAAVYLAVRAFMRWQRNRYRREALAQWRLVSSRLGQPGERVAALATMAVLLKRTALTAYPRAEVAALTGQAWTGFLDRTLGEQRVAPEAVAVLEGASYGTSAAPEEAPAREAAALVRCWIAEHRVEGKPC